MNELPIEASVDEFVNAVVQATGDRVVCSACGHDDWSKWDAAPLTIPGLNVRCEPGDEGAEFGIHTVAFACRRCGLIRLHAVDVSFPPEDLEGI